MIFALSSPRNSGEKLSTLPDRHAGLIGRQSHLTARYCEQHTGPSEVLMRRDELMKPDMFSEVLLCVVGTLLLMLLGSMAWLAIFNR